MQTPISSKIKSLIIPSRNTPEFESWYLEEMFYIECNPSIGEYLLEVLQKVNSGHDKPTNPNQSTIAYLIGCTDERPLNGIRRTKISPPDFDFDTNARDEIKKYLVEKYGIEHVTLLGTYNTQKLRGAIKDVCRVIRPHMSFSEVNDITKKFILNRNDFNSELEFFTKHLEEDQSLREWFDKNSDVTAMVLQTLGNAKATGIHAGGIVLSSAEVKAHCPLYFDADEGMYVTQPEMAHVESLGLIKNDFLGLKTLDDLSRCRKLVRARHGIDLKLSNIPLDDQAVLNEFNQGQAHTVSVFQFNTELANSILTELRQISGVPLLAMITALARRGPLKMKMDVPFIKRANGTEKTEYPHPSLEPILSESFGIIIYQEQVMAICKSLGNFTGDEADTIRKAMGKKQKSVLDSFEKRFLAACDLKSINKHTSQDIWERMVAFAEYGFNKSHAIAYTCTSYLCMWFKHHYPLEWRTAVLMGSDKDDFKEFYSYWKKDIQKPDINSSRGNYYIADDKIFMPLTAINQVGPKITELIEKIQPFTSFEDFFEKASKVKATDKRVVVNLILAGCFDSFKPAESHHAVFRKQLIRQFFELSHRFKKPSKKDLETDTELVTHYEKFPRKEFLIEELKLLNFSSFDYFDFFKDLLYRAAEKHFKSPLLKPAEILAKKPKQEVVVAGAVEGVRFFRTKSGKNIGKEMAIITLSHDNVRVDVTVFPNSLEIDDKQEQIIRSLKALHPFMVKGVINVYNNQVGIIYDRGLLLI